MIEIKDEVEIEKIKTEKRIKKEGKGKNKIEIEVEYLEFILKGEKLSLGIKDLIEYHPLLKLQNSGLKVKAQVSLLISDPQKKLDEF